MATVIDSVRIKAPVDDVFKFVFDWHNVANFYEGVEDFAPACDEPWGNGARFSCTVKSPVVGDQQMVLEGGDFVENHGWTRFSVEGPEWTEHWLFEELPEYPRETQLNYDLKYKVPVPVIGGVVDAVAARKRRTEQVHHTLTNIKVMLENRSHREAAAE